jgi:hypothetical protein
MDVILKFCTELVAIFVHCRQFVERPYILLNVCFLEFPQQHFGGC